MEKYLYQDLYILEESHWWHISKRRVVQEIIRKYKNSKDLKILDIGCGTGKNMENMQKFGKVWGVDSSNAAIKFCKLRGLSNVKLGKAEKTNFKSNSFNVITMLDVLEHTDDNKTLKEMYRILKRRGLLIATVPAFSWLWSEWDVVLHHKRRYTKEDVVKVFKKNNFKIVQVNYLYSFLVIPSLVIRRLKHKLFSNQEYPSDFRLNNRLLNSFLKFLSLTEFQLNKIIPTLFGTSILIVASKDGN